MDAIITICIPMFNESEWIGETLSAVLQQSYTEFNLLISDNASTDESAAIVSKLIAGDERCSLNRNISNIGVWDNFKLLLNKTTTEYVAFVGAHDIISRDYIETLLPIAQNKRRNVAAIGKIIADTPEGEIVVPQIDTSRMNHPLKRYALAVLGDQYWIHGVFRTQDLRSALLPHPNFPGAGAVALAHLALLVKVAQCNDVTYHFRRRVSGKIVEKSAKRERNVEHFQSGSGRFIGVRIIYNFIKLTFTGPISGKNKISNRFWMIAMLPVVFFRYRKQLIQDFFG